MKNKIIQGDALEELKKLPDESIDLCITSPPYYALRNYEVDGQLGLEGSFEEYKRKLLEIIAEIKRVLKPSGQFWLNMGDIYGGTRWSNSPGTGPWSENSSAAKANINPVRGGEKETSKCLLMMPERIAVAMVDEQGWILRNRVSWAKQVLDMSERKTKGSVMPSSVKDRFNESWEYLYFFTKNKKYYSDLDAVRLSQQTFENRPDGIVRERMFGYDTKYPEARNPNKFNYRVRDAKRKKNYAPADHRGANDKTEKNYGLKNKVNDPRGNHEGGPGSWRENLDDKKYRKEWRNKTKGGFVPYEDAIGKSWHGHKKDKEKGAGQKEVRACYPLGKNLPTVWLIQSEPHNFEKELGIDVDHFAIFPQALVEIPIKFGCPKGGIVLDPFFGAGTTGVVAGELGRNYLGIELNPEYIKIAEERLRQNNLL